MEGREVIEMVALLKHCLKKSLPGTRPWFFGCEYKCLVCPHSEPFFSTESLRRHIYDTHVNPWIYLVESGVLESKVEYFHCVICDTNTVKKTFPDIKNHFNTKHEGMTMQHYADTYLFKDGGMLFEAKKENGESTEAEGLAASAASNNDLDDEAIAANLLGIKKEQIYDDDLYQGDDFSTSTELEGPEDFLNPEVLLSAEGSGGGLLNEDGEEEEEDQNSIKPKKKRIKKRDKAGSNKAATGGGGVVVKREKKNVSDAKAEADSNIEKDENYAKMQEILDIAQKKYKEMEAENELNGVKKPYECHLCKWKFVNIHMLKRHAMSHFKIKPFKCDVCGKGFSDFRNREEHKLNLHSGMKKYSCEECGRSFAYVGGLKMHMAIHKGDKKFQCTECGKCFVTARYLYRHMPMHLDYKPHKCEICGKEFTYSTKYYKHKKEHLRETPYRCEFCGKTFNEDSNYYRHRKTHRKEMELAATAQQQQQQLQHQQHQQLAHQQLLQQQQPQPLPH